MINNNGNNIAGNAFRIRKKINKDNKSGVG